MNYIYLVLRYNMKKNKKAILKKYLTGYEIKIFLIVGGIIFLIPLLFTQRWGVVSFRDTGPIGDTIGGVTAPFLSFFGSILVYLALKAQIKANKLVQKQFRKQQKIEFRQNFETTFFNLLSIHHQIISDIDFESNKLLEYDEDLNRYLNENSVYSKIYKYIAVKDNLTSRDVFKTSMTILYSLIEDDLMFESKIPVKYYDPLGFEKYKKQFASIPDFSEQTLELNSFKVVTKFNDIYNLFYDYLKTDFGHYFRNLYRIIKMIDEQIFELDPVKNFNIQYSYISIIRSQLSDAEIRWLFFNCLSSKGREKFKPYLEKYTILKVIDIEDSVYGYYSRLYDKVAFSKPSNEEIEEHLKKYKISL